MYPTLYILKQFGNKKENNNNRIDVRFLKKNLIFFTI